MGSDIYYKDVQLFKSQYTVDKVSLTDPFRSGGGEADDQIVDDMVASAGLKRQDFHVVSYVLQGFH
jgi:DNA topoisomerase VI subunit A